MKKISCCGLIFNDAAGGIWLGKYTNGDVPLFNRLTEHSEEYRTLPPTEFKLVEVEEDENGKVVLHDIKSYPLSKHDSLSTNEQHTVPLQATQLLESLRFPSDEANNMLRQFLIELP